MYWDRMIGNTPTGAELVCQHCDAVLGVKVVYEKENRLAYRLFQDSVRKKIIRME